MNARKRASDLAKLSPNGWQITDLKPCIHHHLPPSQDAVLSVAPLPEIPGFGFPLTLTSKLSHPSPTIWFLLELDFEFFPGQQWPELVEERRLRRPDWIRAADGSVLGFRPAPAGHDPALPLSRKIIPAVIAAATVPLETPLYSLLATNYTTIRPRIKPGRRLPLTNARLYEIRELYLDALADPGLAKRQRIEYVRRQLPLPTTRNLIRQAITQLESAGQLERPGYVLPIDTSRISYRLDPDPAKELNRLTFGADPLIVVDAGTEYEETNWELIRQITRQPQIQFTILEQDPTRGVW
jgi:hypothetical protein